MSTAFIAGDAVFATTAAAGGCCCGALAVGADRGCSLADAQAGGLNPPAAGESNASRSSPATLGAGDGAADHALALRALAGDPPDMVEAVARCRRAVARGYAPARALLDQLSAAADPGLLQAATAREPVLDTPGN